jgi:methionine-gamma-lyase
MAHDPKKFRPESLMMGYGYDPFLSEGSVKPPIFQTSTFVFRTAEEGEQFFKWAYGLEPQGDREMGLIYSRINNPSLQIMEERLALWDDAEQCLSFSSGMAAVSAVLMAHLRPGDVVLHSMPVYGGSEYFLVHILPRYGIKSVAYPADLPMEELEALAAKHKDHLKAIYIETPANPTNVLIDIAGTAAVAKKMSTPDRKVLTMVDNTFLGPVFQHPLKLGADLVVYSATKYIGGHSDIVAGAVCGSKEVMVPVAEYRTMFGPVPAPFNAWLLMRSMETLKLRMEAGVRNAEFVAKRLTEHPAVARVIHPSLLEKGTKQYEIYKKQCEASGSIVSFEVKGGKAAAFKMLNAVQMCRLAVSLGGTESLIEHPASMTHSDIPPEVRAQYGITESMIRLSCGIENSEDLLGDLWQALDASQK